MCVFFAGGTWSRDGYERFFRDEKIGGAKKRCGDAEIERNFLGSGDEDA